jgi:hypothetical protein
LVELQQMGFKASVHTAIKTFSRVVRPILEREREQRAALQNDVSQLRRSTAEASNRMNDLVSGLLIELGQHKREESEERSRKLDALEKSVDAAIAELAGRR